MFEIRFISSSLRLMFCVAIFAFGSCTANICVAETAKTVTPAKPASSTAPTSNYDHELIELYRKRELLKPENYEKLRHIIVKKFVRDNNAAIRQGLGEDYEEMKKWCAAHLDIFEELCCAINEKYDNVAGVFSIFNAIRKRFPDQIEKYSNLAIATAVVWDDGSKTSSSLVHGAAGQARARYDRRNEVRSVDNFAYFVENEKYMHGRAMKAPWEALTFIVYQRTSAEDRKWVLEKYGEKQSDLKKLYDRVPYDNAMWATRFKSCKLRGKPYTFENILTIGGVCVQRSDFSSRVAMNLAFPASRAHGQNDDTFNHEWFTWVDLQDFKPDSIQFQINETGRYKNHHYYIGRMTTPQNGGRLLSYEFALEFETLGDSIRTRRHVNNATRVYPWLAETESFTPMDRVRYLQSLTKAQPISRGPWVLLGNMLEKQKGAKEFAPIVKETFDDLVKTYKNYPDITWRVGHSLVGYFDDAPTKIKMLEHLAKVFADGGRHDLDCYARMAWADVLNEQGKPAEAVEVLAFCALEYPDEGRIIPTILDKIDSLSSTMPQTKGPKSENSLVKFYEAYLPRYFKAQGTKPTKYTQRMFDRAVKVFTDNGETKLCADAKAAYEEYKENKKKKKPA